MNAEAFMAAEIAKLRFWAAELDAWGATPAGQTVAKVACELEANFQSWWLAHLTVSEAAKESGYSEERLREMARTGDLPHQKGDGTKGHLTICRRDLPRRPLPIEKTVNDIGTRLLEKRKKRDLRPAS